jgi:hypothetical protein
MRKAWILAERAGLCALVVSFLTSCSSVTSNGPTPTPPTTGGAQFLYVASGDEPTQPQPNLNGYIIAADGSLTPASCSPMTKAGVFSLVGYGSRLFTSDGDSISVYSVDHSGCLTLKTVTNEDLNTDLNGCLSNCFRAGPYALFLDPKSQNLYSWNYEGVNASQFVTYDVESSTGAVSRSGETFSGYPAYPAGMLAFSGDGNYAVSGTGPSYDSVTGIYVYQRLSDGTLKNLGDAPPPTGEFGEFFPSGAAADADNHFIVAGLGNCGSGRACFDTGSWQLAVYTMDTAGTMTTQSTGQNMLVPPSISPDLELIGYAFSPDGRYFAIGATTGIDVYSWNSTSATLTYLASILSEQPCTSIGQYCRVFHNFTWDRYGHVIATLGDWVDPNAEIQVYRVAASGISVAPGSPYPLPSANMLTVVDTDR